MGTGKTVLVTETDAERLEMLLDTIRAKDAEALATELGRAAIISPQEMPANVVTMNSRVRYKDLSNDQETEVELVYPSQANVNENKISVLAPIGMALLGLAEGDTIEWPTPSGKRALKVLQVLFQPEAEGNFDL